MLKSSIQKNRKIIWFQMKALCVCLLLLQSLGIFAQEYGLKFYSHNVSLEERTELNLTPESFLKFQDEFEVSFDLKLDINNPNDIFGYIFRIINQDNINVDLISTPTPADQLNIIIGKSNTVIPVETISTIGNSWINIRIKFFLSDDRLVFYTPDSFYVHENIGFNAKDEFKIIFGANDYNQFKTTDVPSISVKDIKIFEKGTLSYHWPLDLRKGNVAYDRLKNKPAFIKNPKWLMLIHQTWQPVFSEELKGYVLIATNEKEGAFYFLGNENFYVFTIEDQILEKKDYINEALLLNSNYRAVYSSDDRKIYCYMMDPDKQFSSLNIETGEWNHFGVSSEYETKHRHHNNFFYPENSSVYLFGGYGFHTYSNDVVRLDFKENAYYQMPSNDSVFHPRYLAGLGALNDTVYILGGYGSQSGNQLINPQSYYDLVGYSIQDSTFFKKFEIPRIIDDMAVANSMWIDPETRDYYALIFEKSLSRGYLQLVKGNLDRPVVEFRGNRIPFRFLDIRSFAGLFYSKQQNQLFAYSIYYDENDNSNVSIHSISYPPDKNMEVTEVASKRKELLILVVIIVVLLSLAIIFYKRYKQKQKKLAINSDDQSESTDYIDDSPVKVNYKIIFFGGFQVYNKNYEDITTKFSPLLKELFLLITLYTFKNNKGVSSEKITEILWFDKTVKSARNNRAVNIAKLRSILGEVGAFDLTKKTGYWKVIPDKQDIKSDYIDFLEITSSKTNLTRQKILRLLQITEKGPFLYNVNYEWLDEFKAAVSEKIIDTLIEFANACDMSKEAEFIIHVTDSVFNFDLVNEDAMILKCRAEYLMGKHSLAKSTYEKFFREYKNMYDQEYEQSFTKVLKMSR